MRSPLATVLLVAIVPACTTLQDDKPTVTIFTVPSLQIQDERPYPHSFTDITATINGQPIMLSSVSEGHEGTSWSDPAYPARAVFTAPPSLIEREMRLVITEDGEDYTIEVPDFGVSRAIHLQSDVDTLRADQWIALDDGVATDELVANMDVWAGTQYCFAQEETQHSAGYEAIRVPPEGRNVCDMTAPPAGTTFDAQFHLFVQAVAATTVCDGPDLTCMPVRFDVPDLTMPTTLVY